MSLTLSDISAGNETVFSSQHWQQSRGSLTYWLDFFSVFNRSTLAVSQFLRDRLALQVQLARIFHEAMGRQPAAIPYCLQTSGLLWFRQFRCSPTTTVLDVLSRHHRTETGYPIGIHRFGARWAVFIYVTVGQSHVGNRTPPV